MHRRHVILGSLALIAGVPRAARAEAVKPYDPKTFAAAQETGQGIVLAINASW